MENSKLQQAVGSVQPALNSLKEGIDKKCLVHSSLCTLAGILGYHFLIVNSKLSSVSKGIESLTTKMTSIESADATLKSQLKEIKDILVDKGMATASKSENDYALEKARSTMRSALAGNSASQSIATVHSKEIIPSVQNTDASMGFTAVMKGE